MSASYVVFSTPDSRWNMAFLSVPCRAGSRALRRVQKRGADREPHARRKLTQPSPRGFVSQLELPRTLRVRPRGAALRVERRPRRETRAESKQIGPYHRSRLAR